MPSVSCRNVQNGSSWALRKHGVSVWPDLFSSLRKPALIDARTNCSVAGFAIGEWFGHDEESVKIIVRAVCLSSSKAKHEMVVQRTYSKVIVGLPGLEPGTNGLKDRYSNQLS